MTVRTLYFTSLGYLLYNVPSKYHLQFLRQFLQDQPYRLVDMRAIVKASHACSDSIPPIFEHICAHRDQYFQVPDEVPYGQRWLQLLRFIKKISVSRDFRYNYAPECPSACYLFHSMAEVLVAYGKLVLTSGSTARTKPEHEALVTNATIAVNTSIWMLQNNHTNFSAFKLYNDDTVNRLVNVITEVAMGLEPEAMSYSKTLASLFGFAECVSKQVVTWELQPNKVEFLLKCAITGLQQKKVNSIVLGSSTIENIIFECYKKKQKNVYCQQLLEAIEPLIGDILLDAFDVC